MSSTHFNQKSYDLVALGLIPAHQVIDHISEILALHLAALAGTIFLLDTPAKGMPLIRTALFDCQLLGHIINKHFDVHNAFKLIDTGGIEDHTVRSDGQRRVPHVGEQFLSDDTEVLI